MIRVLFVCLGNICRSPLAQGIFEKRVDDQGLGDVFYADSAGTSGWHEGERPHHGSIDIARQNAVTIEKQKSRAVRPGDAHEFDYFIAIDTANKSSLLNEFGFDHSRVFLMRDFAGEQGKNVPDPYGSGSSGFANVYDILNRSVDGLINYFKEQHPDKL